MTNGPRIGVFVCHCDTNIAATVDVAVLTEWSATHLADRGVVVARDYPFMCAPPGRELIVDDVREHRLDRVVVAACWPYLRERAFRESCESAGVDPSLCEVVCVREQVAWIHTDRKRATEAAKDAVAACVERIRDRQPGQEIREPFADANLVIGGGMAGINAALEAADAGHTTYLLEHEPSIGGYMAQLEDTFDHPGCLPCLLERRMVEAGGHPKVVLLPYSEIEKVDGHPGNFDVTVRRKARHVDGDACDGCGKCEEACPTHVVDRASEAGLGYRKAIYMPFAGAVPGYPVIDVANCVRYQGATCGKCQDACPKSAIDFDQQDTVVDLRIGLIQLANNCYLESTARGYYNALRAAQKTLGTNLESVGEWWDRCHAGESLAIALTPTYDRIAHDTTRAPRQVPWAPGVPGTCEECYLNREPRDDGGEEHAEGPDLLDVLVRDVGLDAIRSKVTRPLRGLRVAPYLGCTARFGMLQAGVGSGTRPERLHRLLEALGAEVVDFPLERYCCGGHLAHLPPETALELLRRIVASAAERRPDLLVAVCPLCQTNVDLFQAEARRRAEPPQTIPIVSFIQLTALAFGEEPGRLGLGSEFVNARYALEKIGIHVPRAAVQPVWWPSSRTDAGFPGMADFTGRGTLS